MSQFLGRFIRKYGTGTGADVYVNLPKASSTANLATGDWTPGAGDVKVSKDGGAAANIGTLPTAIAGVLAWKFVFSDAELQCKVLTVSIIDTEMDNTTFVVETYGHASGLHPLGATVLTDISVADPGGVASTFPQMVVQLWRRFFKKTTCTATTLITYADDGTTARTTQTVSDSAGTQTQGVAS